MDKVVCAIKRGLCREMNSIDDGKGVIFDLDGVLIDSGWAHKQAWFDLAGKEGYKMSDDFFFETFGMQNAQILPMLAGRDLSLEEIDRLSDWKEQRYRDLISDELVLSRGVERLLRELKDDGFLLAIGSSAPKDNLKLIFQCLKLDTYIDACVTKEDVIEGKPAPDTFLRAAQKISLPPGHCVVVEDAIQGIEAAKSAGMHVIAVTTTRDRADLAEADIVVDSLDELKAVDFVGLLAGSSD
jgi:beta-phosphoglucomutase family hydrolase